MSDWATHDHKPAPRPDPAAPKLVEVRWRLVGPSNRPIECGIYELKVGYDVRVGYDEFDFVRTGFVTSLAEAELLSTKWRTAAIDKGFAIIDSVPSTNQ